MTLAAQLSHLERSDLIRLADVLPELEYVFRHALIKDAVYQSMVRVNLRRLHRLVGEIIEDQHAGRDAPLPGEVSYTLAHHFSQAGDRQRALRYYNLAGDAAAAVYANLEAAQRYIQALAAGPPESLEAAIYTQIVTRLGRVQELSGDYPAALATYADLEAEGQRRGDRAMILLALSSRAIIHAVPSFKYDVDAADALVARALPLATELADQAAEARVHWIRLLLELSRGRLAEAARAGASSLALARALGLREQIALTQTDLGRTYASMGVIADSRAALNEARSIWRELGNRPMLAEALTNAATAHLLSGEYDQAAALTAESLQLSQAIGNGWGQAYSLMINSLVAIEHGDLQTTIDDMEAALRLAADGGFLAPALEMRAGLAFVYAQLGFIDRAMPLVRAALAAAQSHMPAEIGSVYAILAYLALRQGDLPAAEAHLTTARASLSIEDFYSFGPVYVALVGGEAALGRGEYDRALQMTSDILSAQQRAGIQSFPYDLGYVRARALVGLGRHAEAVEFLNSLLLRAEAQGALRMLWPMQALQASLAESRGDSTEAHVLRRAARANVNRMANFFTNPELRQAFLGLSDVQTLLAAAQVNPLAQ